MNNDETLDQRKKNIKYKIISLILGLIFVIAMIVSISIAYAWISTNKDVDVYNVNMRLESTNFVYIDNSGQVVLVQPDAEEEEYTWTDSLLPGETIVMSVGLVNRNNFTQSITGIGLLAPRVWDTTKGSYNSINVANYDEIPVEYEGNYYYFGTQLKIQVTGYSIFDVSETGELSNERKTALTDTTSYTMLDLADKEKAITLYVNTTGIDIDPNEACVFELKITFVNSDASQNQYANFGVTSLSSTNKSRLFRTLNIDASKKIDD